MPNSTACARVAGVGIVSACVMLSPLAAFQWDQGEPEAPARRTVRGQYRVPGQKQRPLAAGHPCHSVELELTSARPRQSWFEAFPASSGPLAMHRGAESPDLGSRPRMVADRFAVVATPKRCRALE